MLIRESGPDEDEILVRHYRALWDSYGVGEEFIRPDAEQVVRDFIKAGRDHYRMAGFLALTDDNVVGSAACQLHQLPYPEVTKRSFRNFGYIWHVFVDPVARRQGIATKLVEKAVDHLRSIGCTKAVLHSSPAGEAVYQRLGFQPAMEMRLDL
jgi:GNAT superfamily N-acetyltransferase